MSSSHEDLQERKHLHVDNIFTYGFVAYDNYTRKYSSFYALSLRIENCNCYDAVNEVFSRFVTVMGKGGKKKCEERANSILKVLSAVGEEGVYYNYIVNAIMFVG